MIDEFNSDKVNNRFNSNILGDGVEIKINHSSGSSTPIDHGSEVVDQSDLKSESPKLLGQSSGPEKLLGQSSESPKLLEQGSESVKHSEFKSIGDLPLHGFFRRVDGNNIKLKVEVEDEDRKIIYNDDPNVTRKYLFRLSLSPLIIGCYVYYDFEKDLGNKMMDLFNDEKANINKYFFYIFQVIGDNMKCIQKINVFENDYPIVLNNDTFLLCNSIWHLRSIENVVNDKVIKYRYVETQSCGDSIFNLKKFNDDFIDEGCITYKKGTTNVDTNILTLYG